MKIARQLQFNDPLENSIFLLGPRKVGKSTWLKQNFPESLYIDLLETKKSIKYSNQPYLLYDEIVGKLAETPSFRNNPIIIDEIQKIPILLDEVHRLIENENLKFILCGSSARKLLRSGVNMLGGRASKKEMFPFVYPELDEFEILKVLNNGKIPSHYLAKDASNMISGYVDLYLKEEVMQEGLVRNLRPFSAFLEATAFTNGELVNYSNIARDLAVDSKTVAEYYQILVDTLVGFYLHPYKPRTNRADIVSSGKFYLFDTGITQYLRGAYITKDSGVEFGRAFEHFLITEIYAYKSYANKNFKISFWRDKQGREVDLVLGDADVAIEIKSTASVDKFDLNHLRYFNDLYGAKKSIVVSRDESPRIVEGDISILPYISFLEKLWAGEII